MPLSWLLQLRVIIIKDAPKWRFELGTEVGDGTKFNEELEKVEMPLADPVHGSDGPLMRLWIKSSR